MHGCCYCSVSMTHTYRHAHVRVYVPWMSGCVMQCGMLLVATAFLSAQ